MNIIRNQGDRAFFLKLTCLMHRIGSLEIMGTKLESHI